MVVVVLHETKNLNNGFSNKYATKSGSNKQLERAWPAQVKYCFILF